MTPAKDPTPFAYGMSVSAACARVGVGRTFFYGRLIAQGLIHPVRIGGRTIIPSDQVDAVLAGRVTPGASSSESEA